MVNAFQNPHLVLTDIQANVTAGDQAAEITAFLQAFHKEIAIQKITAYLAAAPTVAANALPNRTAAAAGAIARANDNEYQDYANFIRN